MILILVLLALAGLAIAVAMLLFRNTTSQTARVLTIVACLFVLWSLVEVYINRNTALEFSQEFSEEFSEEVRNDESGANRSEALGSEASP